MSGAGAPRGAHASGTVDGRPLDVVVVASTWHETVMGGLIAGAERALDEAGASHRTVRAVGSFELPILAQAAVRSGADAVVALGVVIRGGTPHFDYVCREATDGISRVALDSGVPVGFGLLTCDDEAQALDRAGLPGSHEDKGYEAAWAAIDTTAALRSLAGR